MSTIYVELGEVRYPITIGHGLLAQVGELLKPQAKSAKTIIVADARVSRHYGAVVLESVSNAGFDSRIVEVPAGDEHKSMAWFAKLHDEMVDHRMDRASTLIALGGGVIGDLAGFVAATYMRGVQFVQVPTTLLAQVDASVGGKTAINHPKGKNLIGAFHQPKFVVIDVSTLRTLPPREIRCGLVEIIKTGVIMDAPLFAQVEANLGAILNLDPVTLIDIITKSCINKAEVVADDEKETGRRAFLNYGHTFGHAIEALTDYNAYRHGEAVSVGMNCAARLAVNLGMFATEAWQRQKKLLQRAGLPVRFPPDISPANMIDTMYLDKKAEGGRLRLILPTRMGDVVIRNDVDDTAVVEAIRQCRCET